MMSYIKFMKHWVNNMLLNLHCINTNEGTSDAS